MNPRRQIILTVLEAAKDAGDEMMTAACRRLIVAERGGFRRNANPADWRMVQWMYSEIRGL